MIPLAFSLANFIPNFYAVNCSSKPLFFFIPPWYEYLTPTPDGSGGCLVHVTRFPHDLLPIGLAILDMLLRFAGLAAVIAIIAAGVGYITAGGSPEKAATARRRIYNAFVGLAIVFVSSAFVAFIGNSLAP